MQSIYNTCRGSLCALALFLFFPAALFAQSADPHSRVIQPIDEKRLVTLAGNRHPLARAEFDRGLAPESLPLERMLLVLKRSPAQKTALDALLAQQQNAGSPNYHKWLTPAQFGEQFGPSDEDVQKITAWLGTHGFQVGRVTHGRTVIEFSGTAGQVQETFHTAIRKYAVNGEEHWANDSDPQIPAALAPVIAGVNTLHNFRKAPMHHLVGEFARSAAGIVQPVQPIFTIPGCGGSCDAVGPFDFAAIYNVLPLWNANPSPIDGTGQTIAIVGETDINPQDVTDFRTMFGLPPANLNIIHDGPAPGILNGEETEGDLDVEWSGAVAKGATIDFVVSASTNSASGVDLSAEYIIDNDLAPVMSESYGLCELSLGTAGNQFYNQLWQQAAAQGITVIVSTGDSGAAGCDNDNATTPAPAQYGLAVNGLASTPYDIAVGGTDFDDFTNSSTYWNTSNNSTTLASAKGYIPETTWNATCTNALFGTALGYTMNAETNCNNSQMSHYVSTLGGAGGASNCTSSSNGTVASCAGGYAKPSWQTGTGVPNDNARDIPDVSLFASNGFEGSFYMICEADQTGGHACSATGNFLGVGGTSASAPAFAGIMALVNQKTQTQQGNANYVLYQMAAQQPSAFNDVTAGTIATPCAKNSPNCTFSNNNDMYGILSGYSATLALNPSANPIPHGTAVPVNISVTPTMGSGTPTGRVSLLASTGSDVANFALTNGSVATTTNSLPGGTYTVSAYYAGDGTFATSNSSPVSVTVSPEASTANITALVANGNGFAPTTAGPYGSIFLQATVQGQSGVGNATGTVNFTVDGQGISGNPFSLNANGQAATPNAITATPGIHSIAASYSGDASFNPGNSTANSLNVTKAATATVVAATSNTGNGGSSVTLTATISSGSTASSPTGTVSFFSGTTLDGSPVAVSAARGAGNTANAMASLSTTQLTAGTDSITAQYSGDGNYSGSISAATNVNVIGQTSTSVRSSNGTIQQGSSATFTATVAPSQSGGPSITGTVQFSENGTSFGSVALSAGGQAQITATSLPPGTLNITASYSGDANYAASSGSTTETVIAGPSFTISVSPASVVAAAPGASASTTLTFTGMNGFSATISLPATACSGLPAQTSCVFSPSSVTLSPSVTTATATLTIVTTAASAAPATSRPSPGDQQKAELGARTPFYIVLTLGLCVGFSRTMRRGNRRSRLASAGIALTAALFLASAGCGTTSKSSTNSDVISNAGTPAPSTSTVTITVAGGSVTQVSSVTLTVQ